METAKEEAKKNSLFIKSSFDVCFFVWKFNKMLIGDNVGVIVVVVVLLISLASPFTHIIFHYTRTVYSQSILYASYVSIQHVHHVRHIAHKITLMMMVMMWSLRCLYKHNWLNRELCYSWVCCCCWFCYLYSLWAQIHIVCTHIGNQYINTRICRSRLSVRNRCERERQTRI